ncbi:hypothetical protein GGI07_000904 [Coemansia sp. Benny D115]|nr:hypothetical protein GGI07_000904 [Coemansia sp. Benny D115]
MNGQGAGNGDINNDELSSFTSFGNSREGLDADTMNLFGSFTNDAGATSDLGAGIGDAGFGQMLTNDLSSFGVDLHSLEMSGSIAENSGVDLSSIQLMNLDEPPLGAGQMAGDAASMMANLLGTQQPNGNQNTEQPQGLGLPAVTGDNGKSRASSQSSDDMGDIPAIRILSGGENEGIQEAAGLKPTVREFMHTVAEVQAGLHVQHRKLVAERIPMKSAAAFHSDVAGFERDLVIWSDVAGLLARAIDSGLKLSSGEE